MRNRALVNDSTGGPAYSEALTDSAVSVLFAGFVLLLFLGYLNVDPGLPFSSLAAMLLVGSLGTLVWGNWSADRRGRDSVSPPST